MVRSLLVMMLQYIIQYLIEKQLGHVRIVSTYTSDKDILVSTCMVITDSHLTCNRVTDGQGQTNSYMLFLNML